MWQVFGDFFTRSSNVKLKKLYTEGSDRIEKEFDIVKIVKSIRNIKVFLKNRLMDSKVRFEVRHSHKNVIEVYTSDMSSEWDGKGSSEEYDRESQMEVGEEEKRDRTVDFSR